MPRPVWYDEAPELANYVSFYLNRKTKIYLGTPYSSPEPAWPEIRFALVNVAAMTLINAGFLVYSPISHSHPLACTHPDCMNDHDLWLGQDEWFMECADLLVVFRAPGWEDSFGLDFELKWFQKRRKPYVHVTPDQIYKIQKALAAV